MNPFVNPNKRGVELPEGFKDLADVLRAKKCEYCDDAAVATLGWPEDFRWCGPCQQDLREFAKIEVHELKFIFGTGDEAAMSQFRSETQRRQDDFMHQRVKERK